MNEDTAVLKVKDQAKRVKPSEWLKLHPGLFGKDTFYARVKDGTIPSIRAGRKILVPDDLLDRMLAEAGQSNDRERTGA